MSMNELPTTTIVGLVHDTTCDCCGRRLKYGIQSSAHGVIGADCLVAKAACDPRRFGRGVPSASLLRDIAKAREGIGPLRGRLPSHGYIIKLRSSSPAELERERQELALRAAAPLRGNRHGTMQRQHDASDLALFRAANEPALAF